MGGNAVGEMVGGMAGGLAKSGLGTLPMLAIMGGGVLLDTVLSYFTGIGEDEIHQMDLDFKREELAKQLGFNYDQLKQQGEQFKQTMGQRINEFAATNKLDKRKLANDIKTAAQDYEIKKGQLAVSQQATNVSQSFGQADRLSEMADKQARQGRISAIASNFKPKGSYASGIKPTAQTTTPQPAQVGTTALRNQQNATNITPAPTTGQQFPLSGQV